MFQSTSSQVLLALIFIIGKKHDKIVYSSQMGKVEFGEVFLFVFLFFLLDVRAVAEKHLYLFISVQTGFGSSVFTVYRN